MNCDQAFERMTDPAGGGRPLEDHLAECARCRDMAEAIAPAVESLAVSASQRASSPTWSEQPPWTASVDKQPARRGWRSYFSKTVGYWAVACLSGVLAWGASAAISTPKEPEADVVCWWQARDGEQQPPESPQTLVLSCVACHTKDSIH